VKVAVGLWALDLVPAGTSILLLTLTGHKNRGLLRGSRKVAVLMDITELLWSLHRLPTGATILLTALAVDEYRDLLGLSNNRVGVLVSMTESVWSLHVAIARIALPGATQAGLVLRNSGDNWALRVTGIVGVATAVAMVVMVGETWLRPGCSN